MELPAAPTTFVGRRTETTRLRGALEQARLVTLTGPGGVGKTRLALRAAAGVAPHFGGRVWLVELAQLSDPTLVAPAAANAVEARDITAKDPLSTLTERLAHEHGLLILDNCEHLVDACVAVVEALMKHAPRMRVLATSREPLRLDGERVFPCRR